MDWILWICVLATLAAGCAGGFAVGVRWCRERYIVAGLWAFFFAGDAGFLAFVAYLGLKPF